MKNRLLVAAAAALLVNITTSYAASPVTVEGTYSLTYTPSNGAASDMSFSSAPGDGAVSGSDLGTNSLSGQSSTNNPFFLDGASHGIEGTMQPLTVGTPETVNFFTADPSGSCTGCTGTTASGTITASFTFIDPSGATGAATDTATYSANYGGTLTCSGGANPADCVVWNASGDPITVNFTDGAVMTITLNNAQDWNITPTVTFDMTSGPGTQHTAAPEPASFAIFGTAMLGLGWVRRRRNNAV